MPRKMPQTAVPSVSARLPRGLIQPLRILIFTGFVLTALFVFSSSAPTLVHVLLITLQLVLSVVLLAECGRSARIYKVMDESAARKRERDLLNKK